MILNVRATAAEDEVWVEVEVDAADLPTTTPIFRVMWTIWRGEVMGPSPLPRMGR